jgi:murein DD-endopeptidase MepM/ murein hydrolase activator NlpD
MHVSFLRFSQLFITTFTAIVLCSALFVVHSTPLLAQSSEIDVLKKQITERNDRLKNIEQEIAGYQKELQKVGSEKSSLQKAINQLELERKKVQADISYTQNKISATDLEINKITIEIEHTEEDIDVNREAIKETLQKLNEMDDRSLVEALLQHDSLSEFWTEIDTILQIRQIITDEVHSLVSQKTLLGQKHDENTEKRESLVDLKAQYDDQNQVLVGNKTEKSELLSATKSEEAQYQKLLKEKEAARELILKEIRDFESKLSFILDPNTIPPKGTRVFNWPIENVIITQYFGGTEFAKQNASVYAGRPYHPGVDFGVPRGTKIFAPLSGTVRATGDTDLVPGCYSWGRWTLIDHANGLSTLYAHQSVISVVPGQQVTTGDVIGYSGNTGYSTGPHLHFTVYAKAGVSVRKFNEIKAVTSCGAATTPVAATDAYIDPMSYLPQ